MNEEKNRGRFPEYHVDYPFMMSGAHRKPAYAIGTPSISWHLSFWQPTPSEGISWKEADRLWIKQIEKLILAIYDQLVEKFHCTPTVSNFLHRNANDVATNRYIDLLRNSYLKDRIEREAKSEGEVLTLRGSRYEAVHVDGVWHSMPISMRFEVFEEYFTLTSTIDFSRAAAHRADEDSGLPKNPLLFNIEDAKCKTLWEKLDELADATSKRFEDIQDNPKERLPKTISAKVKAAAKHVFFEVWDEGLKCGLFEPAFKSISEGALGDIFADFRNLSLRRDVQSRLRDGYKVVIDEKELEVDFIPKITTEPSNSSLRRRIEGKPFEDGNDIDCVDAIFPILLATEPSEKPEGAPSGSIEYTFSKFRSRCIYGSGFGPQQYPPQTSDGKPLTVGAH